ncbi:hypothetical protein KIN20_033070 [Parelaphostrongylus tenuis]|uniref:Thioredoxin domain-containing protein 17 n=1 Tax=Parelaphostrongylus tenuis TaxID=148309 RepID=A0AAD5R7W3_PARTN|nr:hypothetical protein KIN20_033070 [Parelaphostrongylus tenuis]
MLEVIADGYDEVKKAMSTATSGRVFILFTGSKVNGKSWCPDCVIAEPIINSVIKEEAFEINGRHFNHLLRWNKRILEGPCMPFSDRSFVQTHMYTNLIEKDKKYKRLLDDQLKNVNIVKDFFSDES